MDNITESTEKQYRRKSAFFLEELGKELKWSVKSAPILTQPTANFLNVIVKFIPFMKTMLAIDFRCQPR